MGYYISTKWTFIFDKFIVTVCTNKMDTWKKIYTFNWFILYTNTAFEQQCGRNLGIHLIKYYILKFN